VKVRQAGGGGEAANEFEWHHAKAYAASVARMNVAMPRYACPERVAARAASHARTPS